MMVPIWLALGLVAVGLAAGFIYGVICERRHWKEICDGLIREGA